jgi:predicted Zn-dependent peptidase
MAILLIMPSGVAGQNIYTPPGLYDVERVRLQNGFEAVLKKRGDTRSVSFRLMVGIGTRHFDCLRRETPHLLEHLFFTGTTSHAEAELERLIGGMGGTWNAVTGTERTTYQLDIFDEYAIEGMGLLHEIIANTTITPEKVDRVKRTVEREEGGRPGAVRRLLDAYGVGKGAWPKANAWLLPGTGAV